jgi:hypothetical protein
MFKLTEAADLEKAARSLGAYFSKQVEEVEKSHSFHKAMASHHEGLHKAHSAHAAHNKSVHDGMADSHELKHHFGKAAEHETTVANHHEECAKACNAQAEAMKAELDTLKTMAASWGGAPAAKAGKTLDLSGLEKKESTGNPIADMVQETTQALTKKTLESMDTDPEVQEYLRATIMKMVGDAIGDQIAGPAVSKVAPTNPALRTVPRPGSAAAAEKKPEVPLEFAKFVSTTSEEDEDGVPVRVGQFGS